MPDLSNEDIAWAIYHDWIPYTRKTPYNRKTPGFGSGGKETIFVHKSYKVDDPNKLNAWVAVIPNPLAFEYQDGWTPWVGMLGALQGEAPFGSVRAAIRASEGLRLARNLEIGELDASMKIPELLAVALLSEHDFLPGTV